MARGSKTNRLFQHCADVLGSDPAFLDLISVATTNEALQAVSNSLTACLKDAGAPKSLLDPSKLVNNFIAFCNNPLCHENTVSQQLLQALKDRRNLKTTMQEQQRLFVFQAGLNWKSPFQAIRRQQLLDTIPTFVVIDLGVGAIYPPPGHWIAENKTIFNMWDSHLRNCKMKDKRTPRLPIHELDVEKLMHDLLPGQSAIFRDEEGELAGIVIRNFCKHPSLMHFINLVIQLSIEVKRNVRKDDPGSLVLSGFSAGSRSKLAFDWARNIERRKKDHKMVDTLAHQTSAVFALFWNLCRSWLPGGIIGDFDDFIRKNGFPAMNRDWKTTSREGSYEVVIGETSFNFHDVELAPPMGLMASNYSRAVHRDEQPHEWAISWNTDRSYPDSTWGGNFFFAEYGIRVQNAKNTLIAWKPGKWHSTSLQKVQPSLPAAQFQHIGLAFVTSNRLPAAWRKYLENKMKKGEVVEDLECNGESGISYGPRWKKV